MNEKDIHKGYLTITTGNKSEKTIKIAIIQYRFLYIEYYKNPQAPQQQAFMGF